MKICQHNAKLYRNY